MNIRQRLYRGAMLSMAVFVLAPLQDGCKVQHAPASTIVRAVAPVHVPITRAERMRSRERA